MASRLRQNLRSSVVASAAPYGYTLTIFGSSAVTTDRLGRPHILQVLLFLAGAVLAFLLIESGAYGSLRVRLVRADPPTIAVWGNAHLLSSGLSILAVWGTDHVLGGYAGWPVAGFLATGLYLFLNAAQTTLASAVEADAAGRDAG